VEETDLSDHKMVILETNLKEEINTVDRSYTYLRKWSHFKPESYKENLRNYEWESLNNLPVNEHFELMNLWILEALNKEAPEIKIFGKQSYFNWSNELMRIKKRKKNLWIKYKRTNEVALLDKIKQSDKKFRKKYYLLNRERARSKIKPNDPKSFWNSVNSTLKNENKAFPLIMTDNHKSYFTQTEKADAFKDKFQSKVQTLTENTFINPEQEDINTKVTENSGDFFTSELLDKAISQIKIKACYGFDRIPLWSIKEGYPIIKSSMLTLLKKVYKTRSIPEHWKVSRVIPIFKKGKRNEVANYRPISNLSSMAKVFERMLLLHIEEIAEKTGKDFTGKEQHGFKKKSSTITAMLQIQAKISEMLENNLQVAVASIDLSAAFDLVDHNLLYMRLARAGLPGDVIDLIKVWLTDRTGYVECGSEVSEFFKITYGTVQGSVLGPVLFSIYIAPMLEKFDATAYADDSYLIRGENNITDLKESIQKSLKELYEWFKRSGMSVNLSKTELMIINPKKTKTEIKIDIDDISFTSKQSMNILGVTFDNALTWSEHINNAINKTKSLIFGLRRLRFYLTTEELLNLVSSLGFSKLYYGAPVWLSRSLHNINQKALLRASTNMIKACFRTGDLTYMSFKDIHEFTGKFTPMSYSDFSQATTLKSIFHNGRPELVWLKMQENFRENRRNGTIYFGNGSINPHGILNLGNRIQHTSSKLPSHWENLSYESFKRMARKIFMVF